MHSYIVALLDGYFDRLLRPFCHLIRTQPTPQPDNPAIFQQQIYHMWISALAPLLAEPVRKSLGRMIQGNKSPQDINQFLAQVRPKIKELPQDLQVMVLNASKEYWDANTGSNGAEQKKVM